MSKILLTGGSGLLGQELQKYIKCDAPSHREMDITDSSQIDYLKNYDLIIHAAAYTDVAKAEIEPRKCFEVNVLGTMNLIGAHSETPFVYISSEYAKNPINVYSQSKQIAEEAIKLASLSYEFHYLIIRTLFKPRPFPHESAFIDQFTQGDYVDVIAPLIAKRIEEWNPVINESCYVGTKRKTIYQLALKSSPDVKPMSVDDIKSVKLPHDYL